MKLLLIALLLLTSYSHANSTWLNVSTSAKNSDVGDWGAAVQYGRGPDGERRQIILNKYGRQEIEINGYGRDAFGRLRVSNPFTLGSHALVIADDPFVWSTSLAGGGLATYSEAGSSMSLTVPGTAGAYAIRQTKRRYHYQPGKSQLLKITFDNLISETGITKRAGLMVDYQSTTFTATAPYIPANGVYFESTEDGIYAVVIGNSVEKHRVEQSDWDDPLDGTGPSGVTLDFTQSQLAAIDFEWLGVGTVRFGFQIDHNEIYYISKYTHANSNTGIYMKSANLPIRYEIRSDGDGTGSFTQICAEVESEGGQEPSGKQIVLGLDSDEGVAFDGSSANVWGLLFAFKFKGGYEGVDVNLEKLTTILPANGSYRWGIFINPTIGGTVSYASVTNTAFQIAVGNGSTNDITDPDTDTGTILLDAEYVSDRSRASVNNTANILKMGSSVSGVSDVIAVGIMPFSNNDTVTGSMTIRQVP